MTSEEETDQPKVDEATAKKISNQIVLQSEVIQLKTQLEKQLIQAKDQLAIINQQHIFWTARIEQIKGSVATCNTIMQKVKTTKTLVLQNNHQEKKK